MGGFFQNPIFPQDSRTLVFLHVRMQEKSPFPTSENSWERELLNKPQPQLQQGAAPLSDSQSVQRLPISGQPGGKSNSASFVGYLPSYVKPSGRAAARPRVPRTARTVRAHTPCSDPLSPDLELLRHLVRGTIVPGREVSAVLRGSGQSPPGALSSKSL